MTQISILSVAEKPSVARELTRIIAGIPHENLRRQSNSNSNPFFDIAQCKFQNKPAKMVMTSVLGHLMELEFDAAYKGWSSCLPIDLFTAPIKKDVKKEFDPIKKNLVQEAKKCNVLMLWLDCDLEGENIAYEVIRVCLEANPRLDVYRARFSALIDRDIMRTMQFPERPNAHMNDAVDARQEIDLRIGAAFTRFQTLRLQKKFENVGGSVISYGPCQFPTLGFVVERDLKIKAFRPDSFWSLSCEVEFPNPDRDDNSMLSCTFHWDRTRVYDQFACVVMLETCVEDGDQTRAVVTHSNERPTTKQRPVPLNTVELQKRASRLLHINSERTMLVAEALYQRGILSYPRTETDFFKEGFELMPLITEHTAHSQWGTFASQLVNNNQFEWPRRGAKDDQAHPPIHPTKCLELAQLDNEDERKIYDLVVRHFLACCSKDAKGSQTKLSVSVPKDGESFSATGLMVTERNWLEVYSKYEFWSASKVPKLKVGDTFLPKRITMQAGQTTPPEPLNESDLITAMDQNGIGTDATIATHIATIQAREYVVKDAQNRFVPTKLGLALVEGYNSMGYQLNKPQLRAVIEADVQRIAKGELPKAEAVQRCLDTMKTCFVTCNREATKLDEAMSRYFSGLGMGGGNGPPGAPDAAVQYDTLQAGLSTCGVCRGALDLRTERVNGNYGGEGRDNGTRFLFCATCQKAHVLPSKGDLLPLDTLCAICQFQAVSVRNRETGKDHSICPHCFSNAPPPPDGINGATEFRCFSCARGDCELAGRTAGSEIDVASCALPHCPGKMRLKRNAKGGFMLACSQPTCKSAWWVPRFVKSVVVPQPEVICQRCQQQHNASVTKLLFRFLLSKAPRGVDPESTLCPACDPLWQQVDQPALSLKKTAQPAVVHALSNQHRNQQPAPQNVHFQSQPLQQQPHQQFTSHQLPPRPPYVPQQPQQYNVQQPHPHRPSPHQPYEQVPPHLHMSQPILQPQRFATYPPAQTIPLPAASPYSNPYPYSSSTASSSASAAPPVPGPNCLCGLASRQQTVSKAGANQGRLFFACAQPKREGVASCDFFQWADNPTAGSFVQRSSTTTSASGGNHPRCNCVPSVAAALNTTQKEGENKGRRFFACKTRGGGGCGFFQWEDELTGSAPSRSSSTSNRGGPAISRNSSNRGGGTYNPTPASKQICTHCKVEGHFARICPNKNI